MLSYLNYCVVVWGNCNRTKLEKLFKLQKKALRICMGCHYRAHSAPLFRKLKSLNIFDLYYFSIALIGFFYFQNKLPVNVHKMFTLNHQIHNHSTRFKDSFHLWPVKTNNVIKSVRHNFPVIWNSTPKDVTESKSVKSFKKKLKQFLYLKYV